MGNILSGTLRDGVSRLLRMKTADAETRETFILRSLSKKGVSKDTFNPLIPAPVGECQQNAKAGVQCNKYCANISGSRMACFVSEIGDFGQTSFRDDRGEVVR